MKKLLFLSIFVLAAFLNVGSVKAAVLTNDTLIKGASFDSVYYYADGKRYVFPNEKTYLTWYSDFNSVQIITDAELAVIPISANATYRPGARMIKIQTDPKVYAVDKGGILRWVTSEQTAKDLYGIDWNKMIDDVPDYLFTNYKIGDPITSQSQFDVDSIKNEIKTIRENGSSLTTTPPATSTFSGTLPATPAAPLPSNTTQVTPTIIQPVITPTSTPVLTSIQPVAPKIEVSVSSDNPVGRNITKGEKGVTVFGLNLENSGGTGVRIENLKLRLVGTPFSNLQDLKIKIEGQLYSAVNTNGDIKTYVPGRTLNPINPKSTIQVLVQADAALTANSDSFHVEVVEVSGSNIYGGVKTSDVVAGDTFTFYQPPVTSNSPTVSLAPNTVFGNNQCGGGCSYVGTTLRFDAKNNPFSILKIALTFNGVDESDFRNVKLLWGGNVYYSLYPTTSTDNERLKSVYIEGNKIIFQNFSPYELTHVNPNETMDLTIKFESSPTGVGKTFRFDLVNPFTDIIASNYETGLVLSVDGSAIGDDIFINKQ